MLRQNCIYAAWIVETKPQKITESAKKCVGGGEGEGRNIPKTRQIFGIKEEKELDAAGGKDEAMTIIINFCFFDTYLPPIYRWMFGILSHII